MAKMKQIVECVPNFSEGRDLNIIRQITDEVESVKGVKLLDVDPGEATNRTVVTFVGEPDNVVEAAFKAVAKAAQLIDMRQHHGAHPRIVLYHIHLIRFRRSYACISTWSPYH